MAESRKQALPDILKAIRGGNIAPVYLIHGEEYMRKEAAQAIIEAIVPKAAQPFLLHAILGEKEDVTDIVTDLNTYPFLKGHKVVFIADTELFMTRQNTGEIFEKSRVYTEEQKMEEAAHQFLLFLGLIGLPLDDFAEGRWRNIPAERWERDFGIKPGGGIEWIGRIVQYCIEQGKKPVQAGKETTLLEEALEQGILETNHLILTAVEVDKRRRLYKVIEAKG
ncbi:MAG: hypothetical protein HY731_13975, partial [Candidatus Tectomicrobia bacterium]|nr:hypothetical protein [Candidatus Tectomicrobia bacterium]